MRAVSEEIVRGQQQEHHDRPSEPNVFRARAGDLGRGTLAVCDGAIGFTTADGREFTHVSDVVPLAHGPHGRVVVTLDAGRRTVEVTLPSRSEPRLQRCMRHAGLTVSE